MWNGLSSLRNSKRTHTQQSGGIEMCVYSPR
jgi:hypothetical protein